MAVFTVVFGIACIFYRLGYEYGASEHDAIPSAMDVYKGKTSLEYTVVGRVKVDSIVVFKGN